LPAINQSTQTDSNRRGARVTYTDTIPEVVDDTSSQEDHLFAAENAKVLVESIKELSDTHRRVLHLAFFEDMKYEEIALIEDCPVGTVKTRIMHAKKKLLHIVKNKTNFEPFER